MLPAVVIDLYMCEMYTSREPVNQGRPRLLPPSFQIVCRFGFSRFIYASINLEKPKQQTIWDGGNK
jgi:hypothetical protein